MRTGDPCRQILEGHFSTTAVVASTGAEAKVVRTVASSTRPSELLVLCDKSIFLLKSETGKQRVVMRERMDGWMDG